MATNRVYEWVDERTGIKPALDYVLYRRIPKSVDWFFTLGSAALVVFLVQLISGIFLGMGYTPSTAPVPITVNGNPLTDINGNPLYSTEALESVRHMTNSVPLGDWIRGFHHWGANAMVVVVMLHMLHSFFVGSYKYPREMTWFIGVFILIFVLGFSFTGYLLPWDNRAYWATQVGVNIGSSAPVLGGIVGDILRGGPVLGAATLTRFYAIHVLILPTLTLSFIGLHLFLVIKIGISGTPKYKEQISGEFFDSVGAGGKKGGRAFFPYIIFKDAVVALAAVVIIVLLTIFVPFGNTGPADPNNGQDTLAGQKFDPKPEWYFLFLFQFLKIVPSINLGPLQLSSNAIGGVVIPTILVLLLFFAPVLDRSPKRHPFNRPIASGIMILVMLGIVALTLVSIVTGSSDTIEDSWRTANVQPVLLSASAGGASGAASSEPAPTADDIAAGLKLFQANACSGCHLQDGKAAGGVGPQLLNDAKTTSSAFIKNQVRNAAQPMPKYSTSQISDADLDKIASYLRSLHDTTTKS